MTSAIDPRYNCIAWAAGTTQCWWWPFPIDLPGSSWPDGVPREETKESFRRAFESVGYVAVQTLTDEDVEQVAIFVAANGTPTHACYRAGASEDWCSKLGQESDIQHEHLDGVEGEAYGTATVFMERREPFVDPNLH